MRRYRQITRFRGGGGLLGGAGGCQQRWVKWMATRTQVVVARDALQSKPKPSSRPCIFNILHLPLTFQVVIFELRLQFDDQQSCISLTWSCLGLADSGPGCRHSGTLCSGTAPPRGQTKPFRTPSHVALPSANVISSSAKEEKLSKWP